MERQKLYPNLILDALKNVRYPGGQKNIVELGIVEDDIRIDGDKVSLSLVFEKNNPFIKSIVKASETAINTFIGDWVEVKGNISVKLPEKKPKENINILENVKNIVAVFSGKGGVGKSTVSANMAISLAKEGYRVGLLDADIFGPSIPLMFGCEDYRPTLEEVGGRELVNPIEVYGVKVLSIGFFVDKNNPIIWRGAMASNAIKQLLTETNWGELDYLLIDMPPGTSDIHITLVQTIGITGAVVVTTPQQVAIADAVKGIAMFTDDKIDVPVLGLVENMAWFTPKELPENKYYIFGNGGGHKLAEELDIPILGQLPLVQGICESGDSGKPISVCEDSISSIYFKSLAKNVVEAINRRNLEKEKTKKVEIIK